MTTLLFCPISGRSSEITQAVMRTPEAAAASSQAFALQLAVEEVVVNIVNYAYPTDQSGELTITTALTEASITITFADRGIPFNPLTQSPPDLTLTAEERPIGGLGIFLVREMMDEVDYRFCDGRNVLTITKHIDL